MIPFWNQHTKPCNMKLEKGGKCNFLKIINFYSLPLYVPQLTLWNDKLTFLGARGPPGDLWTSLLILTIPLLVLEGPCLKMNNSCSQKTNKMQISANWINIEEWWITLVLRCCVQMLSVIIAPPRKQHLSTKLFLIPQYWFSLQRSAFDYFLWTTIVHLQTWPLKDQWTG